MDRYVFSLYSVKHCNLPVGHYVSFTLCCSLVAKLKARIDFVAQLIYGRIFFECDYHFVVFFWFWFKCVGCIIRHVKLYVR